MRALASEHVVEAEQFETVEQQPGCVVRRLREVGRLRRGGAAKQQLVGDDALLTIEYRLTTDEDVFVRRHPGDGALGVGYCAHGDSRVGMKTISVATVPVPDSAAGAANP